jgi:hypothetical protein
MVQETARVVPVPWALNIRKSKFLSEEGDYMGHPSV